MTECFEPNRKNICICTRYSENPVINKKRESNAILEEYRRQWIKTVQPGRGYYIGQFHEKPTDDDLNNNKRVMLKRKKTLRTIGREDQHIACFRIRFEKGIVEEWHLFDKKPEVEDWNW